jgi:membrane protease YdiL (CAAX protease family)
VTGPDPDAPATPPAGDPSTAGSPESDAAGSAEAGVDAEDAAIGTAAAEARTRISIFSLDGRAAPGLYAAGWFLTVVGLGLIFVALAATAGGAGTYLLAVGGLLSLSAGLVAAAGAQGLQRRAEGIPGYAGPSPFLVLAAVLAVSLLVSALISLTGLDGASSLALVVSVSVTGLAYIGLIGLLVVGTGALTWSQMGIRRPTVGGLTGDIVIGVLLGLCALVATGLVAGLLVRLLGVEPVGPVPIPSTTPDRILNLLAAGIIAPVTEEIFFRGFATTAWLRRIGSSRAIVRGALFFAIVHVLTIGGADASEAIRIAVIAFAARIPVALLLEWVFVRRDSLWASIALHATFNGVALILADLARRTVTGG